MLAYIVEDSIDVAEVERFALEGNDFEVKSFDNSRGFFYAMTEKKPDLILLDILIGNESGFDILDKIKSYAEYRYIPVILASSCDAEADKTRGLDAGADDYLVKPFGIMEFTSRVKALMRRSQSSTDTGEMIIGSIRIDALKREVMADGVVCNLTYKEYELLKYLAINKGIVLSRDKIMENVWGFDFQGESRTVDMHIKTLRQKLGTQGDQIKTVRNVGYKLA
ncbi:MAG: response regulator transcription factor [Lachnospiraceae bacterium]|nr:response regulator transcription factor [Lachnospiraceae bacterium]